MVHTASVIPAAMPGVTVATAWAIQQSDFTETLEANCLLPGPISREGISALRHTYCRTPSPDDRAKRRTPCVFIHAIEGHHPFCRPRGIGPLGEHEDWHASGEIVGRWCVFMSPSEFAQYAEP